MLIPNSLAPRLCSAKDVVLRPVILSHAVVASGFDVLARGTTKCLPVNFDLSFA